MALIPGSGRDHGIFATRSGEKLFQLGRNAVRRLQGRLYTDDNRLHDLTDVHVFYSIFDRLPIWDLLAASRVCVR